MRKIFCKHDWRIITGSSKIGNTRFVRFIECKKCGKKSWDDNLRNEVVNNHNELKRIELGHTKEQMEIIKNGGKL
jgi:hypothetical protein